MIEDRTITTRRRPLALAIATGLSLLAAGCAPPTQSGTAPPRPAPVSPAPLTSGTAQEPAPTPVFTPPTSPAEQQLHDMVANTSLRGTNPANDDYCTYFASNGTLTTILQGSSPEAGSWSVSDGAVCERRGVGATVCNRLDFQPSAQTVTLTPVVGGAGRQTTATVTRGNTCTAF